VKIPRSTIRVRMTALYAVLFGASAAVLMAVSYWLMARHLDRTLPADLAQDALSELGTQYLLGFVGTLVFAVAVGWAVAGRVLAPLKQITQAAREVSEERLDQRIGLDGPPDELRELAETFDAMLDRLAESFDAQRRFIANASHELRSPLTVIRSQAEVALANPEPDPRELRMTAEVVVEATKRTEALLDGLMLLARSQRGMLRREALDLVQIARSAVEAISREARDRSVGIVLDLDPAHVRGDRRLLERVAANLLENGVRYNRPGGSVALQTKTQGDRAVVTVINDGPRVDPEAASRLAEPFQRLGRHADGRGAGLGLSIVRSVIEVHGGRLEIEPRPQGGLRVEVSLPAAPGPAPGRRTAYETARPRRLTSRPRLPAG
jgi:signal transduction histidine kinase